MGDETKDDKDPKKGALLDTVLGIVKGKWVREVFYNVGGRKLVASGGGLAVIDRIVGVAGVAFAWPHAVACLSVAVVCAAFVFATASEDSNRDNGVVEGDGGDE